MSKKLEKRPEKRFYKVETEVLAPIKITYKVFAESAEEALKIYEKSGRVIELKPILRHKIKTIFAKIYIFGTCILELVKKF